MGLRDAAKRSQRLRQRANRDLHQQKPTHQTTALRGRNQVLCASDSSRVGYAGTSGPDGASNRAASSGGKTEWEIRMARKRSRTAVLKRQREVKKSEKQALKREKREIRKEAPGHEAVATRDDLAGYGFPTDEDEATDQSESDSTE
jgi:hypothetical protein